MSEKITWDKHNLDISLFDIGENYTRDEIRSIGALPPNPGKQENWGGMVRLSNVMLIFVTLDKIHANEEHFYNDYFENEDFMWESQNNNTLKTISINRIIEDDDNHLFIRVRSKIKGKTQPFTYAGRISPVDFNENVKPMQFQFECLDYQTEPNEYLKQIYEWRPDTKFIPTTVADPSRPKKRKTSQGFQRDQAKKNATEQRGMDVAKEYYELNGYMVEDKSKLRGIGYDYFCKKGKDVIEVEVKATTGAFGEVTITKNELENTLTSNNKTALFVVYEIEFEKKDDKLIGVGGKYSIIENWLPKDDELTPLSYRYKMRDEQK